MECQLSLMLAEKSTIILEGEFLVDEGIGESDEYG